jgi:hypothetical protein
MCRRIVAVCCFIVAGAGAARAGGASNEPGGGSGGWRLAAGAFAGGIMIDRSLENYRWDTRPAPLTGAELTVLKGRFAAGARFWGARTTQASGIPGETQVPQVDLTGVGAVGSVRALTVSVLELWGTGYAGRLHLGYSPDRLTFDPGGLAEPVTVEYAPISEWEFGYGAKVRTELMRRLSVTVEAGRHAFALDTAHRRGDEIVESREWFNSWTVQLNIAWLVTLG